MAKFGIALGSGPRGRRFKSSHSDQKKHLAIAKCFFNEIRLAASEMLLCNMKYAMRMKYLLRKYERRILFHIEQSEIFHNP